MVYDDTVYTVKVSTRAANGQLEATVSILKDGTPYAGDMVFTNVRNVPPTGDSALNFVMLLAVAAVLLASAALVLHRKYGEAA